MTTSNPCSKLRAILASNLNNGAVAIETMPPKGGSWAHL